MSNLVIPIHTVSLDYYKMKHTRFEPIPMSAIELVDTDIAKIKDKLATGFQVYYSSSEVRSGEKYQITVGNIGNCWFYIHDSPGLSGYSCCGRITVHYTLEYNVFIEYGLKDKEKEGFLNSGILSPTRDYCSDCNEFGSVESVCECRYKYCQECADDIKKDRALVDCDSVCCRCMPRDLFYKMCDIRRENFKEYCIDE